MKMRLKGIVIVTLLIIGLLTNVTATAFNGEYSIEETGLIQELGDHQTAHRDGTSYPAELQSSSLSSNPKTQNSIPETWGSNIFGLNPFGRNMSSHDKMDKWSTFAYVDENSTELVIGVDDTQPDAYTRLIDLIVENGGKLVNTVSIGDEVIALVADTPLDAVSSFQAQVQASNLARYIEPNMKYQTQFVPNDPYWNFQWGPQKIEAGWAWNTTMGDPSVLVAVVDTGVDYNHPDLDANYVALGYDWANNDNNPMDDHGHGTHVAGTIAAEINNGIGIAGLAKVSIMAEKVLSSDGSGTWDWVANGIMHATDQGANIISMSLGGYAHSNVVYDAVKYAYDAGVLLVAAAGNDHTSAKLYPAAYDEVIAVTATDQNDNPAYFTNFGEWVEVAAPGVNIYSTVWDNTYTYMSGTSMATPHVSGTAALIWSQFPNMTRDWVRLQLKFTADDLGDPGFDEYYGYGRINARRAVEEAPPEHDLLITNWKTPQYVEPNSTGTVTTTVLNFGARDESNITVQLLVNGNLVDSALISFLANGTSVTVECSWSSTVEGMCNVTSYVVPVPNETLVENNVVWTYVYVGFPVKAFVLDSYGTDIDTSTWQILNTNWYLYGSTIIYIDYTTLNIDDITYDDLVAADADVLIISCAFMWEFTDSEIDAISRYVREGHGLIATAGTLYSGVPNNNKLAPLFGLNETTTWSSTSTDLLHIENTTHPLFVDIPNPFVFRAVGTAIPWDYSWDSNELFEGTYVARGHFKESAIVVNKGLVYISPWLEVIPPYYHFNLQLLYNAITWSKYQKPEHELVVSLECPFYLELGESTLLNATVSNKGLNNETNVELQLLIDGSIVNSTTIPELLTGASYTINYFWTPMVEATYNVTAYAPPVPGENFILNNVKSTNVLVQVLPNIIIVTDDDGSSWIRGTSLPEFESALTAAGYDYWVWNESSMGHPPLNFLTEFQLVIWTCGDYWGWAVDPTDAVTLESYLAQGGNILLEGEDIGYNHHADSFMVNVAHAIMQVDVTGAHGLTVTDPIHPVTSDLPTSFTWLTYPPYADGVSPTNGGAEVIQYTWTPWTAVTVFEEVGIGSVVYYSFPLYCLAQPEGETLTTNSVSWLLPQEHDLAVALETLTFLEPGVSSLLNATVYNQGLSNETDVELQLLIDGTVVNSTTIPELLTGSSHTINYFWTPPVEATYNVTAYAPPVPDENFTINNRATKLVTVTYPLIRPIEGQWANYTLNYYDNMDQLIGTGLWNLTYDHYVDSYLIYITVWYKDPSGYVGTNWMIVNTMNRWVESGVWAGMWYPGWIETNITIGSTVNLLDGIATVVGSRIIQVDVYLIDCWELFLESYGIEYTFLYDKASGLWVGMDYTTAPYRMEFMLVATNIPIGVRYDHEIAVTLEAPTFLELSESSLLNATVYNIGLSNETDVELQLLINGTLVNSTIIPKLVNGTYYTIDYLWTPTLEATYNVTAYAPPVHGENVTANNFVTKMVNVRPVKGYILFDQTRWTDIITSYSVWVANLTDRGYVVETLTISPITPSLLDGHDVFVIPQVHDKYSSDELSAIQDFVLNGGGLLVIGDDDPSIYTDLTGFAGINWISGGVSGITYDITPHDVTVGVTSVYLDAPMANMLVTAPAQDLVRDPAGGIMLAVSEQVGRVIGFADEGSLWDYGIAQEDNLRLANNMIDWLLGVRYEHELTVTLEAPAFLEFGDSSLLNATVQNRGLNNETNVELFLLVNGTIVNNVTILELPSGMSYTIDYLWTPTLEATYNVTAYAPPIPDENVTTNNFISKMVTVSIAPPMPAISVEPPTITAEVGETFTININIKDITDLYGYEFMLNYTTAVLTATEITLGDFFPPDSMIWHEEINEPAGYVWYAVTMPLGTHEGTTGSGTLATITFTVDSIGESRLDLWYIDLRNSEAKRIVHNVYDGYFSNVVGARITIDPTSGPVGTMVSVNGISFSASTQVRITFNDMLIGYAVTDNVGTFTFVFNIPFSAVGPQTVKALDAEANYASTTFTVIDITPLDVEIDVGAIHFKGELAEFYAQIAFKGVVVNASSINALLYKPNGVTEALTAKWISTGFYKISYTIPGGALKGTYALVIEASYTTSTIEANGTSFKSFLISETLTGWNALLISINGTVGTIKTDVGLIEVKLDDINAKLVSIEGNMAAINSTIGLIWTNITTINATIVDIQGGLVTINSTLGEIQVNLDDVSLNLVRIQGDIEEGVATITGAITDAEGNILVELGQVEVTLDAINATLTSITGRLVTIETDIGTVNGTITSIQDDVATIETDIGTVKATLEGWTGGTTSLITTPLGTFQILVLTTSTLEYPITFADNVLMMSLSGPLGTTGTINVVIPKQLLTDIGKVAVTIDDQLVVFTYTEQPETYVLSMAYTHSTHTIRIYLAGLPPTLPWALYIIATAIIILAASASLAIYMLKIRKPRKAKTK